MKPVTWKQIVLAVMVLGSFSVFVWAASPSEDPPADVLRAVGHKPHAPTAAKKSEAAPREKPAPPVATAGRAVKADDEETQAMLARARTRYENVAKDMDEAIKAWENRMAQTLRALEQMKAELPAEPATPAQAPVAPTVKLSTVPVSPVLADTGQPCAEATTTVVKSPAKGGGKAAALAQTPSPASAQPKAVATPAAARNPLGGPKPGAARAQIGGGRAEAIRANCSRLSRDLEDLARRCQVSARAAANLAAEIRTLTGQTR